MADQHTGHLQTYVSYEGMGKHYTVKVNGVGVWGWSFAMDGPIDPEVERLFMLLHDWATPVEED